jgi:hypothetical protein
MREEEQTRRTKEKERRKDQNSIPRKNGSLEERMKTNE